MNVRFGALLIAALLAADQVSKALVEANLPFQTPVPVLPVLSFFRTYNQGIAFSFFSGFSDEVLIALTLAVMVFVIWLWRQAHPDRIWARLGFALVLGGALGNLIDRVVHGHVIDFIMFHTQTWSFAVFNLADSSITVGAVLIAFDELLELRRAAGGQETRKGETSDE
ncbi:MAG: signal peptidase II [Nitratireductor sp.]|nr:signal peptidase II [Nitratireductor sp.]